LGPVIAPTGATAAADKASTAASDAMSLRNALLLLVVRAVQQPPRGRGVGAMDWGSATDVGLGQAR
jgi:hypothetical protein